MGEETLPVIGVGASAGGLEALREMFGGFDGSTGMAFVIIQHLDPTHESLMAQLIERYTTMTVRQVEGGELLKADNVYVIPPGHGLMIRDNHLNLTEFSDPRGMRRPIDDFFESLADDRHSLGSCVILSGTGGDGSRGLRAIKEFGGIAVVQDPETARYDGMPISAISTGLVDVIAEPADIITALQKFFAQRPELIELREEASEVTDHIDELCTVLQEAVGHDFSGYKRATLTRRIARRMQVLSIGDANDYLERTQADSEECEALFRDLLINVTRFFRDADEFNALNEKAVETLIANCRDAQEIRVWVPGCSSGEEAYTIAMMFAEAMRKYKKRPYINIFATDIDDKMLNIAREGFYPLSSLGDLPAEYQHRYTIGSTDHFSIVPQIRDMVRFSLHNLVRDPPFSKINLISCRNLLIYFNDSLQKLVMPLFHFALNEGGYLFLGSSEAIGRFEDLFKVVDQSARIFQRNNVKSNFTMQVNPQLGTTKPLTTSSRRSTPISQPLMMRTNATQNDVLSRIAEKYAPVSILMDAEGLMLDRWGRAGKYLEFPDRTERNLHVPTLARLGLRDVVGPILRKTVSSGKRNITRNVKVVTEFGTLPCTVICDPVTESSFLLIIREDGALEQFSDEDYLEFDAEDGQLHFLEEELQETRHRLRSTVEELETTNEELKSSNEEMMSMNEELQSTNEELTTVNDELKSKVDQVTVAHSDLKNFFDTTELIVLVIDAELKLRSFTEAAKAIFPVNDGDTGRLLEDLPARLTDSKFMTLAKDAATRARQANIARIPGIVTGNISRASFRTGAMDGAIDGATLVFTDITDALLLEKDLREERERLRLALEVAKIGIWEYEPATDITVLDETERALLDIDEKDGDRMDSDLGEIANRRSRQDQLRAATGDGRREGL